jgi:AraC-like DNA-binding protein
MGEAAFRIEVEGPALPSHAGLYGAGQALCRSEPARGPLHSRYAFACVGVVVSGRFDYHSPIGTVEARPGVILLGNAAEDFTYRYLDTSGVRRSVIALDAGLVAEVADDCGRPEGFSVAAFEPGRRATGLYAAIRRLAAAPRPQEEAVVRLAAAALAGDRAAGPPQPTPAERRRVRELAAHLDEAHAEPLTLGRMAALTGLSRFHLIRVFRAVTGETPHQYLIGARLRAAADRLLDTREPVTSIALGCGFNDLSHFNLTFRRAFGLSPRAWRRS